MKCRSTWPITALFAMMASTQYPSLGPGGLAVAPPPSSHASVAAQPSDARAAYEQSTGAELAHYDSAIAQSIDGKAERLSLKFASLQREWDALRLTSDAEWSSGKDRFEASFGRFKEQWETTTASAD